MDVIASDHDGDSASGTVSLFVSDDEPTSEVAGDVTVVEGQTASGTWSVSMGADQPGSVVVEFGGATYAIDAAIDTGKGTLTVKSDGTWEFVANDNLDNDLAQSISFAVTATDEDNDVASDPHTVAITDGAGPTGGDTLSLTVDDEALDDDGNNPGSAAEVDDGMLSFTAGSDALTSFAFSMDLSGLDSSLTWVRVNDTTITGSDGGRLVVTLTLSAPASIAAGASGDVTVTATLNDEYNDHPLFTQDDTFDLGDVDVIASDHDGDSASGTVSLFVSDDEPVITNVTDAEDTLELEAGDTQLDATGDFAYSIGADINDYTSSSDFVSLTLGVTVGGANALSVSQPVLQSEDANSATFSFSFTYDDGPITPGDATANGSIVFDKVNGTYTVSVDPIESFSIETTSQGSAFTGYQLNTSTTDNTQPTIAVTTVRAESAPGADDGFYVQFDSSKAPGNNSLNFTGGNNVFDPGEVMTQNDSWVSVSNDANGVAGDTVGKGEVLDMTFYSSNPFGFEPGNGGNPAEIVGVSTIFFKLDGIGNNEDAIVILKLLNTSTMTETTIAISVQNSDMLKQGDNLGQFSSVTLDNNDALIVIEPNDYLTDAQIASGDWVIIGAQVAAENGSLTGPTVNLNGAVNLYDGNGNLIQDGGSDTVTPGTLDTSTIQSDTDDTGFKISDIGFISTQSTPQEAVLTFDAVLHDADGDTVTANQFTVTFSDSASNTLSLASSAKEAIGEPQSSMLIAGNDNTHFQQQSFSHSLMLGAAIAVAYGTEYANVHTVMKTGLADFEQGTISFAMPQSDFATTIGADGHGFMLDMPSLGGGVMAAPSASPAIVGREAIDHGDLQGSDVAPVMAAPAIDALPAGGLGDAPAPMAMMASDVVMPGAQALAIMAKESAALAEMPAEAVDKTIAEALAGGDANPIDGVLAMLGGGGSVVSEMAMIPDVPLWDSGLFGGFTQSAPDIMVMEAMVLHHDAITPAANG
ncbi:hypothetical protein FHS50_000026 [Sphingomicrobium lutaoense]|uniref:DUF5801 domain-containing protein n=1 Tax=Sphingomicrobium lutaoense TaxID=515949 RepID=A0A839Z045_9SPHN|nr:hypothetical protein [Sphingomicrobium lutaoense]